MKKKTEFQQFIIRILNFMIEDESFKTNKTKSDYKKLLTEILRRYFEFTKDHKNILGNLDLLKKHCKISERAVKELRKNNFMTWIEAKSKIHREHILPVGETIKQLGEISEGNKSKSIEAILDKFEIVLLTKEESQALDKTANKIVFLDGQPVKGSGLRSKGEPEERLNAIGAKIHKDFESNALI